MKGKKLRMRRIFEEDGNTLILAMDHGAFMPAPGLERPGKVIREVIEGGANAILTTFGLANRFAEEIAGKAGLILRLDGGSTVFGRGGVSQLFKVEDAIKAGADAVACMGYIGSKLEMASLKNLANVASECERFGVPLLAEMIPMKKDLKVADVKLAARVGAEMGADFVKTIFMRTRERYKEVVENCFVPIVVLGGEKMKNEEELLEMVKEAMESGVRGVCLGRNIWQNKDPKRITEKIATIVHGKNEQDE